MCENILSVLPIQEAFLTLDTKTVTLSDTVEPVSLKVTGGSENWAKNVKTVTIISEDGSQKVLDVSQYEVTADSIQLICTDEDPILTIAEDKNTSKYTIEVTATGYNDMTGVINTEREQTSTNLDVSYRTHVQTFGWQDLVSNGERAAQKDSTSVWKPSRSTYPATTMWVWSIRHMYRLMDGKTG